MHEILSIARFYFSHPDIFKFIAVLSGVQLNTPLKINSLNLPAPTNTKYKKWKEYVNNFISLYKNNSNWFCKMVSYRFEKRNR